MATGEGIEENHIDCLICTQTIQVIYDIHWGEYWRFTDQSMRELLSDVFEEDQIEIYAYGNMKAAVAFMFGLCQEEMNLADLEYQDEQFPMIIAAIARKK